jgi:hypothetical protein
MTEITETQLREMNIAQTAEDFQADLEQTSPAWLWSAFIFNQSPQGHDHWADRATGELPLTEADREWLGEVLEALKRREASQPALRVADDLIEAFIGIGRAGTPEGARLAIVEATPRDRLDVYCHWNGILGYSSRLADIMEDKIS